jgi:hypothetical protein
MWLEGVPESERARGESAMRLGAVPCENADEDGTTGTPVTTGSLGEVPDEEGAIRRLMRGGRPDKECLMEKTCCDTEF